MKKTLFVLIIAAALAATLFAATQQGESAQQTPHTSKLMRQTREELHGLAPRIEAIDLSGSAYPHPAFGPLNFYQWLAFIGVHDDRHLGQIERTLSA